MKIKVWQDGCCDCSHEEWIEWPEHGVEIELPKKLVLEWRRLSKRFEEIQTQVHNLAAPQERAKQAANIQAIRAKKPEDRTPSEVTTLMWIDLIYKQTKNSVSLLTTFEKIPGNVIIYDQKDKQ